MAAKLGRELWRVIGVLSLHLAVLPPAASSVALSRPCSLAPSLHASHHSSCLPPPPALPHVMRMRGGAAMNPALVERELEKIDDDLSKQSEHLHAKEPEAMAEWEKLKERFNRRAEELQMTGRIAEDDDEEREDGYDPEVLDLIADEPLVSLTRRNYTMDDPWVNPDTEAHEYVQSLLRRTKEDLKQIYKDDESEADCLGLAFVNLAAVRPFGTQQAFPQICQRQRAMAFTPRRHGRARLNPMFCPANVRNHRRVVQLRARQGPEEKERANPLSRLLDLASNRTSAGDIDAGLLACDAAVVFSGIFACGAVRAGAFEGASQAFGILKPLAISDGHLWESLNLGGCISVVWLMVATLWGGAGRGAVMIEPERAGYGALNAALVAVPVGMLLALAVRGQPMEADLLVQSIIVLPLAIAGWRYFLSSVQGL